MKKDAKSKLSLNPKALLHLLQPIAKHHYVIGTVILFGGLAVAIYLVNETLNTPSDEEYRTKQMQATIGSKFNKTTQETIEKIKALQKSTDPSTGEQPFPAGRINPFAE